MPRSTGKREGDRERELSMGALQSCPPLETVSSFSPYYFDFEMVHPPPFFFFLVFDFLVLLLVRVVTVNRQWNFMPSTTRAITHTHSSQSHATKHKLFIPPPLIYSVRCVSLSPVCDVRFSYPIRSAHLVELTALHCECRDERRDERFHSHSLRIRIRKRHNTQDTR